MAELDPQTEPSVESAETVEWRIPPNRPRKVNASMWGPVEIVAVSLGAMAVIMAALAYFFFVVPSDRELAKNKSEADRLEAELISAKTKYGEITTTEDQVSKIVTSIDDFEARFLPVTSTGQSALYQRLNALIAAHDLVNTTGPDYAPLETEDLNGGVQTEEQKGRSKYRSLYPGVYVTTTLEGSYQNLRRFIREIETGRDFVIVSSVELAPSDSDGQREKKPNQTADANPAAAGMPTNPTFVDPNNFRGAPGRMPIVQPQPQPQPQISAKSQGKTHGEVVSLHIELAAYFRRPNMASTAAQ